ncbi:type I restriction enzyme endonuclease domain-containing protein [Methylobacter sp.]|uniref:type I restriction enzyme endonuclease domain-containing protein n=1 Tax=Methylobacter sp. TaxID=2051955 RepID=UPI003DA234D7
MAHKPIESLRQNLSVDWSECESIRAELRLMAKRILSKFKHTPAQQESAVELILQQAQALGKTWVPLNKDNHK